MIVDEPTKNVKDILDDPILSDPDAHGNPDNVAKAKKAKLDLLTDEQQTSLMSHILFDPKVTEVAEQIMPIRCFTRSGYKKACEFVFDYWRKYAKLPPMKIIIEEVRQRLKGKLEGEITAHIGKLNTLSYLPLETQEYWIDEIKRCARTVALNHAYDVLLNGDGKKIGKENYDHYFENVRKAEEITNLRAKPVAEFFIDEDVAKFETPVWQIDECWHMGNVVCLFGSSGSGKTFIGLDAAYSVATGQQFLGHFEAKSGLVAYVCSEGGQGEFKVRHEAWKTHHGIDKLPNFAFTLSAFDFNSSSELKRMVEAFVKRLGGMPSMIVVDTLAANFGGGDIDKGGDMRKFLDNIHELKRLTGATILIIHHTGWSATDRETGSKQLRNAMDVSIIVERKSGADVAKVKFVKRRGGKIGSGFAAKAITVGESCVMVYDGTAKEADNAEAEILDKDQLEELLSLIPERSLTDTVGGITAKELMDETGRKRAALYNDLKHLVEVSSIVKDKTLYYRIPELTV